MRCWQPGLRRRLAARAQRIVVIRPLFLSVTFDPLQRDVLFGPFGGPEAAAAELAA
jgi:hypothetical protein